MQMGGAMPPLQTECFSVDMVLSSHKYFLACCEDLLISLLSKF